MDRGDEQGQLEAWCLVRPGELEVVQRTVAGFFAAIVVGSRTQRERPGWRAAFASALQLAVSIVLDHTRPPMVRVLLEAHPGSVTATIHEYGRFWEGEPGPAEALAELDETCRSAGVLDEIRHERHAEGSRWTLVRSIATAPRIASRTRARAPSAGGALEARLRTLIRSAGEIGRAPQDAHVPYTRLTGTVGELARALEGLRQAARQRLQVIEESPVGIGWAGADGRWQYVNRALHRLHGRATAAQMVGNRMLGDVDPEVMARHRPRFLAAIEGRREVFEWDNRVRRPDGTVGWMSVKSVPVLGGDGRVERWVVFAQDSTERVLQKEKAIAIQRRLLPQEAPALEGYELAGDCLPAMEMSGDLYDWWMPDERTLDITLADVMGKGMGAALVMAALRSSLRAAPADLGPAARAARAADAMGMAIEADDIFVTAFHARVDLTTGTFRYVDAGHGHWAIRRANGQLATRKGTSLPLFVTPADRLTEAEGRLEPGDTLVVYSDGLVEVDDRVLSLAEYERDMAGAPDASTLVRRLLGRMPAYLPDDVTVVAVRRTARRAVEVTGDARVMDDPKTAISGHL